MCFGRGFSSSLRGRTAGEGKPMKSFALFLAVLLFAGPAVAGDVDIAVGPGGQHQHPADALAVANAD